MSMPPQSGWQPPQQSGPPPGQGQPHGQSGYNPPPGWQQGAWPQQAGPPPQKGSSLKWLLVGVGVLLVIAISVGATLLFTRDGGGGGTTTATSGAPSDIASANDTGPVAIITDEPTCATYLSISNSLSDIEAKAWGAQRTTLGPVSDWTPEQRSQVEEVATAMRNAADQTEPLLRRTPHRLVREIYEQFIAYGRAYADSVPTYTPQNNGLASANVNAGSAIVGICNTITYGAATRSLAIQAAAPPTTVTPVSGEADPQRFVTDSSAVCIAWTQRLETFTAATPEWQDRDTTVPASNWTPERKAIEQSVRPALVAYSNEIERAGRDSGNPAFEDFAVAASLYTDAFLSIGDNYNGAADGWLNYVAFRLANLVSGACRAVAG